MDNQQQKGTPGQQEQRRKSSIHLLTRLGILLFVVTMVVNRFFLEMPTAVYLPLQLVSLTLMILGHIRIRRSS